jgi:hypothetical protein
LSLVKYYYTCTSVSEAHEFEGIRDEILLVARLWLVVFKPIEVAGIVELFMKPSVWENDIFKIVWKYSNLLLFIIGIKCRLMLMIIVGL